MKLTLAVASIGALVSTSALAQERVVHEPDRTVVRKQTTIELNELVIDGTFTEPGASYALGRRTTTFKRLFKVRDNFDPELQKSVENL